MTQNPAPKPAADADPIIPPSYLLGLAGLGLLVAVFVALTQPAFDVFGWGGLALAVLALIGWALLSPARLRQVFSSRWLRYGGLALIVLLLVSVALIGLYTVARGQNWRADLTQSNAFSLSPESEEAIRALAADGNMPPVSLIAFYPITSGAARDRDTALFESFVRASDGRISFTFVDPDREVQQANLYGVSSLGQVAVVAANADGTLDTENAELVTYADQELLTNAILSVTATGQFVAQFLTVRDGYTDEMTLLSGTLSDRYDWTVEQVSLAELTAPEAAHPLNDPNVDGQLLILPGGSAPLAEAEMDILRTYLERGGDLLIFAGTNLNADGVSLATDPALNAMLAELFGVQFNNDVVMDKVQAFQSPLIPMSTELNTTAFVTTNNIPASQGTLIFETPPSITLSETAPAGVTASVLAQSSASSFATTDLARVLTGDFTQAEGDTVGPHVLAAQAENANTGARVVLFSSPSIGADIYAQFSDVDNIWVSLNGVAWASNFNNYVAQITVQQETTPAATLLFADEQTLRMIGFVTLYALPFGILLLGVFIWWSARSRRQAAHRDSTK